MSSLEPLSERRKAKFVESWWFPSAIGSISFLIAFATTTQGLRAAPWQAALFMIGIFIGILDGFAPGRVIAYATFRGPDERANEAEARFYQWRRARIRYAAAVMLAMASALGMWVSKSNDVDLIVYMVPFALYVPLWALDLFRSVREANCLFPPSC